MLLFPFRPLRYLTLGPRIVGRTLLRPRHRFIKTAILLALIAALVRYFVRRRNDGLGARGEARARSHAPGWVASSHPSEVSAGCANPGGTRPSTLEPQGPDAGGPTGSPESWRRGSIPSARGAPRSPTGSPGEDTKARWQENRMDRTNPLKGDRTQLHPPRPTHGTFRTTTCLALT